MLEGVMKHCTGKNKTKKDNRGKRQKINNKDKMLCNKEVSVKVKYSVLSPLLLTA
jgi:hypothetical protein